VSNFRKIIPVFVKFSEMDRKKHRMAPVLNVFQLLIICCIIALYSLP
jgi:hypothetical protein